MMKSKSFAFKLGAKATNRRVPMNQAWYARPGVALAGCTENPGGSGPDDLRDRKYGIDMGNFC